MTIKLGVVMDPIGAINFHKDSTLAMLLAASKRSWELYYMEQGDLYLEDNRCHARLAQLEVRADENDWFSLSEVHTAPLDELDVILMRKDPPVDMEFIYTTFLLERAAANGALVVNSPAARLPRVSPPVGIRASACGNGSPFIIRMRLSPAVISGT